MTMHGPSHEEEFQQLMTDGLLGWKMVGAGKFIELGGNTIESNGGTGLLWYTHQQFQNFILRAEWRAFDVTDNSGIFIRFPDPSTDLNVPITQGYEVQIDNTGHNPDKGTLNDPLHQTGAIYKLAPSHAVPAIGQWHTFELEAKDTTITVRLDGQQVSQLKNASRSPKGFIGLQNHHTHSRVQFKPLKIKELP
jgi:hypothetical protein